MLPRKRPSISPGAYALAMAYGMKLLSCLQCPVCLNRRNEEIPGFEFDIAWQLRGIPPSAKRLDQRDRRDKAALPDQESCLRIGEQRYLRDVDGGKCNRPGAVLPQQNIELFLRGLDGFLGGLLLLRQNSNRGEFILDLLKSGQHVLAIDGNTLIVKAFAASTWAVVRPALKTVCAADALSVQNSLASDIASPPWPMKPNTPVSVMSG